jgi:hypothetical protein
VRDKEMLGGKGQSEAKEQTGDGGGGLGTRRHRSPPMASGSRHSTAANPDRLPNHALFSSNSRPFFFLPWKFLLAEAARSGERR